MSNTNTKIHWIDIVFLITLASTLLYIVVYNTPPIVLSFRYLWGPVTLMIVLFLRPSVLNQKFFLLLLLYGAISILVLQYTLWSHMSDWNVLRLREEFYWLIVICSILAFYWSKQDYDKMAILSKWAMYFILITIITTHIALFVDPFVVRSSVNSFIYNPLGLEVSRQYGTAAYGYAQSLVLLIPILIYFIKAKQKHFFSRPFLIIFLLLLLLLLLRANVFANVLVAIPVLILSIIGKKKRIIAYFTVAFLVVIALFTPVSFLADLFMKLSNYFEGDSFMHGRLIDFSAFIETPELDTTTQAGGRAARYPLLMEAFLAKPIFGDASYSSRFFFEEGGHLYWMNRLAIWGVLGFSFFVYVLYSVYKTIVSAFDKEFAFYYHLSILALIGLGLTKSIQGREQWLMLFLVIPGLYFLSITKEKQGK